MKKTALLGGAAALIAGIAIAASSIESGLNVGDTVPAFHPKHIAGPHKGTDACPPCTWGARPQVQVWVGYDKSENSTKIAKALEAAMKKYEAKELKAFMIHMGRCEACTTDMPPKLEQMAKDNGLERVAVAFLPSADDPAAKSYKINGSTDVKNTIFVYSKKKVVAKFVNLVADEEGLAALNAAIAKVVE